MTGTPYDFCKKLSLCDNGATCDDGCKKYDAPLPNQQLGFAKNDKAFEKEKLSRLGQKLRWKLQNVSEGIAGDYAVHEKIFMQMAENGLFSEPSSPLDIEKLSGEERLKAIDKLRSKKKNE
jgi:hypothetical protein